MPCDGNPVARIIGAYGEFTLRLRSALNGKCVVPTNLAKRPMQALQLP